MEIVLLKQLDVRLEEPAASHVREFLFQHLDGATDQDKKAWRRFVRALHEAGSGEYFTITIQRQRVGKLHRKQMALETKVFNAQERIKDREQFRLWLKLGAGFVDWMAGPKGGVFPVPRSISFSQCSEEEADDYRSKVLDFLRSEHAQHYLWPALSPQMAEQSMESILQQFERQS
jgi:hypothetical protein